MSSKKWMYSIGVILVIAAGILTWDFMLASHKGQQQTSAISTPSSPSKGNLIKPSTPMALVPVKSLPSSVITHLSSYASRLQKGKPPFPVHGDSILVIDPTEQYAIAQFQQVWRKIQPVEVLWTQSKNRTQKVWEQEGYKKDPLSSSQTEFVTASLFTPVAYHRTGATWQVLNGVLRPAQSKDWVNFFKG